MPTTAGAAPGGARIVMSVTFVLLLLLFWALTHRYAGLDRDARIYAFQALSRLHPNFTADLYLQNTSQDRYTVFSPFYAFFIDLIGLENAALTLTIVFTVGFLAAAWAIAKKVGGYELAWVSVALMMFTSGDYGALGVFQFPESYLTARLPAYALVAAAVALHLWGYKRLGLCVALAALAVHPIMVLPGLLLILCLTFSIRVSIVGALAGILFTSTMAAAVTEFPSLTRFITVIDPPWFEVVRERSQFLFLQFWSFQDWDLNVRAFLSLAVTAAVLKSEYERRLSVGAILVGVTGLVIAFIGGDIGPIALLVQGQAWRWEWISCFVAVLLLPQTIYRIWNAESCGPICSILLLASCTVPAVDGALCASVALLFWCTRRRITIRAETYLRWAAAALVVAILAWVAGSSWKIAVSAPHLTGHEPMVWAKLRQILREGISAMLLFGVVWRWTITLRSKTVLLAFSAVLTVTSAYALRRSVEQTRRLDSGAYLAEFSDWREVIPATSSVFVAPAPDTGQFVWFSLQRPNYLSEDQSAGVVFSRATALEVKRRSDLLLPVEDPNWMVTSEISMRKANPKSTLKRFRPLTTQSLIDLCRDPQLGFVMSTATVGFGPLLHKTSGKWKDWKLYDCRNIRSQTSS